MQPFGWQIKCRDRNLFGNKQHTLLNVPFLMQYLKYNAVSYPDLSHGIEPSTLSRARIASTISKDRSTQNHMPVHRLDVNRHRYFLVTQYPSRFCNIGMTMAVGNRQCWLKKFHGYTILNSTCKSQTIICMSQ